MPLLKEIKINNKDYKLYHFTGKVVDEKKWSETQVSGGGGGGVDSSYQGTGFSRSGPVRISSTTTEHDQFILENSEGEEQSFKFHNLKLSCRKGHILSSVWCIKKGKKNGPYWFVYNHNTKDVFKFKTFEESIIVKKWITILINTFGFLAGGLFLYNYIITSGTSKAMLLLPFATLLIAAITMSIINTSRLKVFKNSQDYKDIFTRLDAENNKFPKS